MKDAEKQRMMKMGALEFWNESVVYYRNKKDNAKTVAEFIDNMDLLKVSRSALAMCERRLLCILLSVILSLAIACQGCQTVKGATGDAGWILTKLSDNIQTQEK